jgi:PTH1 family peptidyl-tRNA hydrolase
MDNSAIKLIVGLGNYSNEYLPTRHNVGFWFIDQLAHYYNINLVTENKLFATVGKIKIGNHQLIVVKPHTYMNLSGKAVLAVMNFYKITTPQLLIVHDDLDFMPGISRLKLASNKSSGGHNGIKSINQIVNNSYWRLRIGIGRPLRSSMVESYVLNSPSKDDNTKIMQAIDNSISISQLLLVGDFNTAMKQLHTNV